MDRAKPTAISKSDTVSEVKPSFGEDRNGVTPELLPEPVVDEEADDLQARMQKQAFHDATTNALSAGSLEEGLKFYEEYIRLYPNSPYTVTMMNTLGIAYARVGRYEDALKVLDQAIELAGDDRFVNTIEVNVGYVYMEAGDLEAAKEQLKSVMDKPVPDSLDDPYAVTPQLFTAPSFYARVLVKEGKFDEADELLRDVGERALKMARENPDVEWLPSYAVLAYENRVNAQVSKDPPDFAAARALAEEFHEKLPNSSGGLTSYEAMLRALNYHEEEYNRTEP